MIGRVRYGRSNLSERSKSRPRAVVRRTEPRGPDRGRRSGRAAREYWDYKPIVVQVALGDANADLASVILAMFRNRVIHPPANVPDQELAVGSEHREVQRGSNFWNGS